MPADPHHGATALTKPQQRMLRNALAAQQGHTTPVRPYRSEWRTFVILEGLGLLSLQIVRDENTSTRYYAHLTDAGHDWALVLQHLGKP